MSVVPKLVIASLLVATGLGVAYFLGKPAKIQRVLTPAPQAVPAPALASAATKAKPAAPAAPLRAQLLPGPTVTSNATLTLPETPALLSSLAPIARSNEGYTPYDAPVAIDETEYVAPQFIGDSLPTARLRNEAPRPLGYEPRSPVVVRRLPPVESVSSAVTPIESGRVNTVSADWSGSQTVAANFSADANSTAASAASFNMPVSNAAPGIVGPPPWPASVEPQEARMHVIVDGDSLQRLASRYLDDPQRDREIFELNRDVLTNPDLLPIGAELKIPERVARSSWNRQGYRPSSASEATIRSAANGNLVPIRSPTAQDPYEVAAPRAVLARPISID